jgi:ADP-heptose:LPS heptosyltransferase
MNCCVCGLRPSHLPEVKPPLDLKRIKRILIVKWSAMGDVAMATAVMEDLRRAFPEAVIDLNVMPAYEGLFAEDDRFERVFSVDLKGEDRGWRGIRKWLSEVKSGGYDAVFDFQSNDRSWSLFALWRLSSFKVPVFVGHHKRFPYKVAPPKLDRPPRGVDGLRRMLEEMGIEANTPCPVIGVSESRVSRLNDLLESEGLADDRFILLCPGSQAGGHLKRWGAERYAALARRLMQDHDLRTVIVGGPDEVDECARVHELSSQTTVNLCGRTEVLDLVPLGRRSMAVVANDTGPGHILAAADKPMVCICGPTDPLRVKPICSKVETLQAEVECRNCYLKECPNDHVCMEEITVDMVMASLGRMEVIR